MFALNCETQTRTLTIESFIMPEKTLIPGICIYCSDPRLDANLWKLVKERLIQPKERFAPIGVLGGPISLANQEDLPIEYSFLMAQIYFALTTFPDAKNLMVIGHDCGYYSRISRRTFTLAEKRQDLVRAANFLQTTLEEAFPDLKISAFFQRDDGDGFERFDRQ